MAILDQLKAYLPALSPERLDALREESKRSVGGGEKGPCETALAFEVLGLIEEERNRRGQRATVESVG